MSVKPAAEKTHEALRRRGGRSGETRIKNRSEGKKENRNEGIKFIPVKYWLGDGQVPLWKANGMAHRGVTTDITEWTLNDYYLFGSKQALHTEDKI